MKKKFLSIVLTLTMIVSMMPTAFADGGSYVAEATLKDGTAQSYTSISEAVSAAGEGGTVKLLNDITSPEETAVVIKLPANATLDGDGATLSGNVCVEIDAAGGTVKNVNFKNIHNISTLNENEAWYGFKDKVGKLTAVYAGSLTGTANIMNCTFDNVDWDAIQSTPKEGATINITGNTFRTTGSIEPVRYIHVQSAKNVDFSANITNNEIYDGSKLNQTGFEIYYFADPEKVNLSGNYIAEPTACCIYSGNGVDASEKIFPMKATADEVMPSVTQYPVKAEDRFGNYIFADDLSTLQGDNIAEIELLDDVTLGADAMLSTPVVVPAGRTVTLDLNGKKLSTTVKSGSELETRHYYAVDNYGTFTLTDTRGGGLIVARGIENLGNGIMTIEDGTIEACDSNGGAAIWNEADLTINGGTLIASSSEATPNYGAGCLNNSGTATITAGVFDGKSPRTYAIISTGDITITPAAGKKVVVSGVHGGLGIDSGTAVVNGGSYSSTDYYGLYVSNDGVGVDPETAAVTVNGGTFCGKRYSVWIGSDYNNPVNSTIKINDGNFNQPLNAQENTREGAIVITGGYFTGDPTAYLADGKATLPSNKPGYTFMVDDKAATTVKPATGTPAVTIPDTIPEDKREAVEAVAKGVLADTSVLAAAANTVVGSVTEAQMEAAAVALQAENSGVNVGETDDVHVYAQTYLDIKPVRYDADTGTVTLDIQPMYRVVASTEELASNLKVVGETSQSEEPNAVILPGSEKPLTSVKTIEIAVKLPDEFNSVEGTTYYAKHIHNGKTYYYPLTFSNTENDIFVTFTNTNGFSEFTLPVAAEVAASINGTCYATLQDAVNAVTDGQTIKLEKDNEETIAFKDRTITFIIDSNGKAFDPERITAGANTKVVRTNVGDNKTRFAFTYTRPSGGSGASGYTLTFVTNGGSAVDKVTKEKNTTIDLSAYITTREGYTFDGWYADKDLTEKVTSVKLDGSKTVYAKWTKNESAHQCAAEKFTDVDISAWYHEAVDYVLDNGMMNGTGATAFAPNAKLSRGMIAQVLYNLENRPGASGSVFNDVASDAWYADAVSWAAAQGIVNGYGSGKFGPTDNITREQMALILFNYAKFKGYDVTAFAGLDTFADGADISVWAQDAVKWAVGAGLLSGKGGGILDPHGTATRAEVAQIFMNFCKVIAE